MSWKMEYAGANAGRGLVDSDTGAIPFYNPFSGPIIPTVTGGVAKLTIDDSPALPLTFGNNVLPAVGGRTNLDVTYNFVVHATIAYTDRSLYCIGQQSWNVRFAGVVTQPTAMTPPRYRFAPNANNASTGSGPFGSHVRNNADPIHIGPDYANAGGGEWR